MNVKSVISVLLGSLILINIGHNSIPHHHHLDDKYSHEGCEQHDADKGKRSNSCETGDPARHCHAFNGLEYVRSYDRQIDKEPLSEILDLSINSLIIEDGSLPPKKIDRPTSGAPPDFQGFPGDSPGLRAPPSIS